MVHKNRKVNNKRERHEGDAPGNQGSKLQKNKSQDPETMKPGKERREVRKQ